MSWFNCPPKTLKTRIYLVFLVFLVDRLKTSASLTKVVQGNHYAEKPALNAQAFRLLDLPFLIVLPSWMFGCLSKSRRRTERRHPAGKRRANGVKTLHFF
ncbi:MAG: hypothetical protein JSS81_22685 [Acidobacteria bacterium]|nr:hypothetical protein [Acidobacteriota bacterium]